MSKKKIDDERLMSMLGKRVLDRWLLDGYDMDEIIDMLEKEQRRLC